ncbi:MAG: zf-HC2 domain-containing protein [Candidatus Rokubacteria bacterium]|nr:zf-HC2 domain-containing protein [Candidatus Rokubacteria bacterium]
MSIACATPLERSLLVDYWLAELAPAAEERVEEHLLSCVPCSGVLRSLVDLAAGIRTATRKGIVRAVVTRAFLERLRAEGLHVREYRVVPGGSVQCTVAPEDDLVVARLSIELEGIGRVDLAICDDSGREKERVRDIPVSGAHGEVIFLPRTASLRAAPAGVDRLKLLAVEQEAERLLAEYVFVHTPLPAEPA